MCGLAKKVDMLTEFYFTTVNINLESIALLHQYFLILKKICQNFRQSNLPSRAQNSTASLYSLSGVFLYDKGSIGVSISHASPRTYLMASTLPLFSETKELHYQLSTGFNMRLMLPCFLQS